MLWRLPEFPRIADPSRFACLTVLLLSLALLRFGGWVDGPTASRLIISAGYPMVVILVAVFVWAGFRAFRAGETFRRLSTPFDPHAFWIAFKPHWAGLGLVILLSAVLHMHEPTQWRTQNDEFAILSTSQMAHHERTLAIPSRFYYLENKPFFIGAQSDIRLPLFAVLCSFLHDLTGYRPGNTFLLNQVFTPPLFPPYFIFWGLSASTRVFLGILACLLAFFRSPLDQGCEQRGAMTSSISP